MEKLLQWSIAQQTGDKESAEKIGQPDPKLLEQLFGGGGPDEPALMKQSIMVVENPEATLENKQIAFDNFEMLIENLDNANNIENLKLWTSIINQLSPEVDDSLKIYAASIIGTAVQNNPNSQEDFLKYCPQGLTEYLGRLLVSTVFPSAIGLDAALVWLAFLGVGFVGDEDDSDIGSDNSIG
ncbi:hsp70 nucleotide exchange factor fes1 [Cerrena zonata]|uniref:Hsp70 nucleotide exchange factor fes1 n=1 Tax=Cerrena zonata TaxID=2478898 RepID=A0AAW0FHZ0_9APHY